MSSRINSSITWWRMTPSCWLVSSAAVFATASMTSSASSVIDFVCVARLTCWHFFEAGAWRHIPGVGRGLRLARWQHLSRLLPGCFRADEFLSGYRLKTLKSLVEPRGFEPLTTLVRSLAAPATSRPGAIRDADHALSDILRTRVVFYWPSDGISHWFYWWAHKDSNLGPAD